MVQSNIVFFPFKKSDSISNIYSYKASTNINIPLYQSHISAGFPSPADDHIEKRLDLNKYMVQNSEATFFVTVDGDSMKDVGIFHGDLLVVDRSLKATNNKIVVAVVDGELTVKRLLIDKKKFYLAPENADYPIMEIKEYTDFSIWGVVTGSIRKGY